MKSHRVNSPIVEILWGGWKTDTLTLQKHGWDISVEPDIYDMRVRFAIKHDELGLYGITQATDYDPRGLLHGNLDWKYPRPVFLQYLTSKLTIQTMDNLNSFVPMDAQPTIIETDIRRIEDFNIWRKVREPEQSIIVEPQSVPELLSHILELQSPKQFEIREKRRKEIRALIREDSRLNDADIENAITEDRKTEIEILT
jgi:hypothetical protein